MKRRRKNQWKKILNVNKERGRAMAERKDNRTGRTEKETRERTQRREKINRGRRHRENNIIIHDSNEEDRKEIYRKKDKVRKVDKYSIKGRKTKKTNQ